MSMLGMTNDLPAEAGPRSSSRGTPTVAVRARPGRGRRLAASGGTAFATLGLIARTSAETPLPYTATTILLPPEDGPGGGTAYIFVPTGDNPNAVDFLALNISTLSTSTLQPTKLSSTLPFLSSDGSGCTTFAPSLLRNGTIAVLAGDCSAGSTSTLWTYHPSPDAQWTQHPITPSSAWDNAQSGPYHLGGMLSFSAQLSPTLSPPTLYLYGGMCPSSETSSEGDGNWQTQATYSNRMLRLTPESSLSSSSSSFTLSYAAPKGQQPPVAEAGFTLTELAPSISNRTSGNGGGDSIVTQQTSHVLLGGHTQSAFVNMSTAAVWSLPEETWSFVGIAPPAATGKTADLVRQAADAAVSVDSRSGHSAVLSEDGTRLVVYGGWVGDVGQRAEPQLAVVKVGVGLGDWEWEVPAPPGHDEGTGVYGHGAVVLPGNVMMVYGGYEISAGEGGARRRQVGGGKMFYNITSMSWSDEYVIPPTGYSGGSGGSVRGGAGAGAGAGAGGGRDGSSGSAGEGGSSSDDSSRTRQIGLGVGLGVGLLLLAVLAALGIRWFRQRQRRRAARDETLRSLAQGVNGSLPRGLGDDDEMFEREHGAGMFPWTAAAAREWYTGGDDPYVQGRRSLGYETLRSGSKSGPSLYIPPPPSASSFSNRPKGAKGLYLPTTGNTYDFAPLNRSPNRIEPIYEADEDEEGDLGKGYPLSPDKEEHAGVNGHDGGDDDDDDPFLTPTLNTAPSGGLFPSNPGSNPQQPQGGGAGGAAGVGGATGGGGGQGQQQHPDVQGWVSDVVSTSATTIPLTSRPSQRRQSQPKSPTTAAPPTPTTATTITTITTSSTTTATAVGATGATGATGAAGTGRVSPLRRGASTKSARHSLVSAPTDSSASVAPSSNATDDGRTESNLSERSAFSFVRGSSTAFTAGGGSGYAPSGPEDRVLLSRLRTTLATTATATVPAGGGGGGGGGERLGSSGGTSSSASVSGNSYNTARSNFAALQAEGPGLLLGPSGEGAMGVGVGMGMEEEDDGGGGEYDYVYVPPGSPSKSKPRRSWFGSLKRVFSGGTPESGSHGSGGSLRGESPTREGLLLYEAGSSDYDGRSYGGGLAGLQRRRLGREAWLGEGGNWDEEDDRDLERAAEQRTVQIMFTVPREQLRVVNAEVEREESVLIVDPEDEDYSTDDKGSLAPAAGEGSSQQREPEPGLLPPLRLDPPVEDKNKAADRLSRATLEPPAGVSPSPSLRASSITSTTLHTAEAVRLERPKTRVLAMVESFESRSREGSPSGSPVRGS